jgi:hypothetical protein
MEGRIFELSSGECISKCRADLMPKRISTPKTSMVFKTLEVWLDAQVATN